MNNCRSNLLVVMVCWGTIIFCSNGHTAGLSYADNQPFPHGYVDFNRAGALALTEYPFATIGNKYSLQTSYRSLYGLQELSDRRLAAAYRTKGTTFGVSSAMFGKSGYFQQLGLGFFGSYRFRRISFGISGVYSRISFNESYSALDAILANAGAAVYHRQFVLYAASRTINQPRYSSGGARLPVEGEIGLSCRTGAYLDNQAKALFIRGQRPTAQLLQAARLAEYAEISYGFVLSPIRIVAGLSLEKNQFGFAYQFSHHPVLGMTHNLVLSLNQKDANEKGDRPVAP